MIDSKTMRAAFGQRLLQARLRTRGDRGKPLTQAAIATLVGVTPPTISQYESGSSEPDLLMIALLARALGVPAGWLAFGRERLQPPSEGGMFNVGPVEFPASSAMDRTVGAQTRRQKKVDDATAPRKGRGGDG